MLLPPPAANRKLKGTLLLCVTCLAPLAGAPTSAAGAGGSLLSGYGGPGGGEQVILGQQLYAAGAKHPSGGPTPATGAGVSPAAVLPTVKSLTLRGSTSAAGAARGATNAAQLAAREGSGARSGPSRPAVLGAYQETSQRSSAGLPVAVGDFLPALFVSAALALVATGMRRLGSVR